MRADTADIAIIGASAAGLAAAIFAGEAAAGTGRSIRIVALEGARKPGAKILVSGGGRCNVTNERITPSDYDGGPQPVIRNVLRAFNEERTIEWMRSMEVELKLEPTGKYFPVSDSARSVLDALLIRVRHVGVELRLGARVTGIVPRFPFSEVEPVAPPSPESDFRIDIQNSEPLFARRIIMATGGLSLPKSGSDGAGLNWMRQLGHTTVPTTPALVPLVLGADSSDAPGARFAEFAGVTLPLRLTLVSDSGESLAQRSGSTVFTHFGLSGPAPMDLSRHIARYTLDHPGATRVLMGHPEMATAEAADSWLQQQIQTSPRRLVTTAISALYPERIAAAIADGLGPKLNDLTRTGRLQLAQRLAALPLNVVGNRGYSFAETTAGGVDLREIDARNMKSRRVPGMFICGEMLDVDGRIGGFNFQWAWASGYLAGRGAIESLVA